MRKLLVQIFLFLLLITGFWSCNDELPEDRNHVLILFDNRSDRNITYMWPRQFSCYNIYFSTLSFNCNYRYSVLSYDTSYFRGIMIPANTRDTIADYFTDYDLEYEMNTQVCLLDYDTIILKQFRHTDSLYPNVLITYRNLTYNYLKQNNWTVVYP